MFWAWPPGFCEAVGQTESVDIQACPGNGDDVGRRLKRVAPAMFVSIEPLRVLPVWIRESLGAALLI